jgi:hypothetical protein
MVEELREWWKVHNGTMALISISLEPWNALNVIPGPWIGDALGRDLRGDLRLPIPHQLLICL